MLSRIWDGSTGCQTRCFRSFGSVLQFQQSILKFSWKNTTAHRVVGYFEEEAVYSYTEYLAGVEDGSYENVTAPDIAIDYWKLAPDARLREIIIVVRADEASHRDVNHEFANKLS